MRQKCSGAEQKGLLSTFHRKEKQQQQQQQQRCCPTASHLPFQPIAALAAPCSPELCHPWPLVFCISLKTSKAEGVVQQCQRKDTVSGCHTASFIPAALGLLKGTQRKPVSWLGSPRGTRPEPCRALDPRWDVKKMAKRSGTLSLIQNCPFELLFILLSKQNRVQTSPC